MKLKSPPTVWLVDDDRIFRFVVKRLLESTGLVGTIGEFDNGMAFRKHYETQRHVDDVRPDIMFVDLFMPEMDGWGVLETLKQDYANGDFVPVVYVMTSSIDKHDVERVGTYPFVLKVVQKPVNQERLVEALNTAMNVA